MQRLVIDAKHVGVQERNGVSTVPGIETFDIQGWDFNDRGYHVRIGVLKQGDKNLGPTGMEGIKNRR